MGYDYEEFGTSPCSLQYWTTNNKKAKLELNPHYSDSAFDGGKTRTVFGKKSKCHYVYSDRFAHRSFLGYCVGRAVQEGEVLGSAGAWEKGLTYYHGTPIKLLHIEVGVNGSSGYAYQIFGFTQESSGNCDELAAKWEAETKKPERKQVVDEIKSLRKAVSTVNAAKNSLARAKSDLEKLTKRIAELEKESETGEMKLKLAEETKAALLADQKFEFPVVEESECWLSY